MAWALLLTYFFQDMKEYHFQINYESKSQCVHAAKQEWHDFYNKPDSYDPLVDIDTLCKNRKDSTQFVRIRCDKNGVCRGG